MRSLLICFRINDLVVLWTTNYLPLKTSNLHLWGPVRDTNPWDDVTRYCKSCKVCQKTVNKGSVPMVPLEKMPLIGKPLKIVAIDLVGPICSPSEDCFCDA